MNKLKSLIACVLCTMAFSSAPTKAAIPPYVFRGAALIGGAFAVNTVGYAIAHMLTNWNTEKLKPLKYGLIGGITAAGLITDILFIKQAVLFKTSNLDSAVRTV